MDESGRFELAAAAAAAARAGERPIRLLHGRFEWRPKVT